MNSALWLRVLPKLFMAARCWLLFSSAGEWQVAGNVSVGSNASADQSGSIGGIRASDQAVERQRSQRLASERQRWYRDAVDADQRQTLSENPARAQGRPDAGHHHGRFRPLLAPFLHLVIAIMLLKWTWFVSSTPIVNESRNLPNMDLKGDWKMSLSVTRGWLSISIPPKYWSACFNIDAGILFLSGCVVVTAAVAAVAAAAAATAAVTITIIPESTYL